MGRRAALAEIAPYSATKAALQMLARSIALEHAKDGIRCNLVAPGIVNAGLARAEAERNAEYAARAAKAVPLGALQQPEDVAAVVDLPEQLGRCPHHRVHIPGRWRFFARQLLSSQGGSYGSR